MVWLQQLTLPQLGTSLELLFLAVLRTLRRLRDLVTGQGFHSKQELFLNGLFSTLLEVLLLLSLCLLIESHSYHTRAVAAIAAAAISLLLFFALMITKLMDKTKKKDAF